MTDECKRAVERKNLLEGTDDFKQATTECTATIARAFSAHREQLKLKLKSPPKSSKEWWKINRELLNNAVPRESIPALQNIEPMDTRPGEQIELVRRRV